MILVRTEFRVRDGITTLWVVLAVAVLLCFALGFLVEKWLRGKIKSFAWAVNYGFMILFANCAVCALLIPKFG